MIGIIPCRYQSTRFPGKPLADIGDKPMMWHVYHQALKARELEKVYIATDDFRIADTCAHFKMNVLMTSKEHLTGTDRIAECANELSSEFFVNIQGDEPFISPESIDSVARALRESDERVSATNAFAKIFDEDTINSPNVVKVILSKANNAIAFSRSPIPYGLHQKPTYLRQLGLYAFKRAALTTFTKREQGPLEMCEAVEMLRFIENGDTVRMVEVEESGLAVDTPEDLHLANKYFEGL